MTDKELSLYNGTDTNLPILLGLNGSIYDVSANPSMYGPGGSYSFFAGRDASRAFVTGCFDTDLNGDLRGVEEMFMPVEEDVVPGPADSRGEGPEKAPQGINAEPGIDKINKRGRKLRRERERRVAKKQVAGTIDGWRKMFDGGKGGKYFFRGTINREEGSGWGGWGPVKELCEKAREGRPRRTADQV